MLSKIIGHGIIFWRVLCHPITSFYRGINNHKLLSFYHKFILPFVIWQKARKKVLNVLFLAMNPDMWKYDGVFRRMSEDHRFHPMVIGLPRNSIPMEMQLQEQREMALFFRKKGFEYVDTYDETRQQWIDLREWKPDIIFYTQPYRDGIDEAFRFYHHLSSLICYTPYYFQHSKEPWNWNNPLQNYCWRQYYANQYQFNLCKELSNIKGANAVIAGYCLEEDFRELQDQKELIANSWHHDTRKRVIWAPHHSISNGEYFRVSSFLEICHEMVILRKKFKEKVIFAFKPHPVLKSKLYKIWGKKTTDAYYDDWACSENSFYAPGDYKALFLGSDAMIHCCGSFMVEYHYTGKPVQYVYSKSRNPQDLGEISDLALAAHYPAHSIEDIDRFIQQVVIEGHDRMQKERQDFASTYLKSPNGKMFSENVVQDILHGLGRA